MFLPKNAPVTQPKGPEFGPVDCIKKQSIVIHMYTFCTRKVEEDRFLELSGACLAEMMSSRFREKPYLKK